MAASPDHSSSNSGSPPSKAPANAFAGGKDAASGNGAAAAAAANASGAQVGHAANGQGSQSHFIRRSKNWDHAATRRSSRASPIARQNPSDSSPETPVRRNSSFSEYSLSEARDIINPRPVLDGDRPESDDPESSPLASLSLAFALIPAVAGALFKNGSSVATDVMLLGLAAVFLHWSVTQPWLWYHAAQKVRVREEAELDSAIDDESDANSSAPPSAKPGTPLQDVQEEDEEDRDDDNDDNDDNDDEEADDKGIEAPRSIPRTNTAQARKTDRQSAAVRELYRYEILALLSCFAFPLMSAYLLHAIRSQLSRPSEGLVSNYNLTIFLMASELRFLSHLIKLVQSRTLHLQRIVHQSPYAVPVRTQLDRLVDRLERLEAMSLKEHMQVEQGAAFESTKASMTRDIRSTIQPELDALNRAVRRYEKKAALLQSQTDSKLSDVYERLDNAIAFATHATRDDLKNRRRALYLSWVFGPVTALLNFSLGAIWALFTLPFKPLLALFGRGKQVSSASQPTTARNFRNGKTSLSARHISERVPTRLMKRC